MAVDAGSDAIYDPLRQRRSQPGSVGSSLLHTNDGLWFPYFKRMRFSPLRRACADMYGLATIVKGCLRWFHAHVKFRDTAININSLVGHKYMVTMDSTLDLAIE